MPEYNFKVTRNMTSWKIEYRTWKIYVKTQLRVYNAHMRVGRYVTKFQYDMIQFGVFDVNVNTSRGHYGH